MTAEFVLYENPGWGSAIIEAQLAVYGMPVRLVPAGGTSDPDAVARAMAGVNPLGQVPALVLPGGAVMTETAAMTLHMADLARSDVLVPGPEAAERAAFLRWLVFLVAAVYPSFAYGDVPTRFVPEAGAEAFQARVIEHRKAMWRVMEAAAVGPWFLGARFSAIDVYLAVMTRWRPGQAWFQTETPRLWAAGQAAGGRAEVVPVMARNFG
ncbi:glutathione S-transferase family protein [Tabrizicola sp. BL-A-41-H6]|uniref:glutathione S-transferase family protein n=1 Tax=Tabrizicola sp. BL-A-41-H6 TaxID=3421107 RepID=UPI003D66929C